MTCRRWRRARQRPRAPGRERRRAPGACATEPVALTVACPRGAGVRAVRGRWRRPGASSTTAHTGRSARDVPRPAAHRHPPRPHRPWRDRARDVPLGGRPGTRHQLGEHPRLPRHVQQPPSSGGGIPATAPGRPPTMRGDRTRTTQPPTPTRPRAGTACPSTSCGRSRPTTGRRRPLSALNSPTRSSRSARSSRVDLYLREAGAEEVRWSPVVHRRRPRIRARSGRTAHHRRTDEEIGCARWATRSSTAA